MKVATRAGRALSVLAAVVVSACGGGMGPMDAGNVEPPMDAAVAVCAPGTEGCECASNRCGKNTRGEQLLCQGGVCTAMMCPAGDPGCVCRAGSTCNDPGSTCSGGFCVASNCGPGDRNCVCLAGGCSPGNFCLEGSVCVDSKGYEGGQCLDNGRCLRGNRCDPSTGVCVFCTSGSAGCSCNANEACGAGLRCTAGLCLGAAQLPPTSPRCYTPCGGDVVADGGLLVCGADRLIRGCLDGLVCNQGTCGAPGGGPRACVADVDCPVHQVCLTGACYSNCDVNADCPSGMGCFRHACRPSCTVGPTACGAGMACTSEDGQQGFCTPSGRASASLQQSAPGGFLLPVGAVELSNVRPRGSFTIVSKGQVSEPVTVRKLWHLATSANGTTERVDAPRVTDGGTGYRDCDPLRNECPMPWLSLQAPGVASSQGPTITFMLDPRCADTVSEPDAGGQPCPAVTVSTGATNFVKWEGVLELTLRDASATVHLSYVQRPDGQWTGSMYYFGTFNDANLASWINSSNKASQSFTNVDNGLIQRWTALRLNALDGWQEFLAVLTATREESWKWGTTKQRCGLASACYPYSGSNGIRTYVSTLSAAPIPSGVTELPVALNLKVNPTESTLFEGRVVSSVALHYPGNPTVKLQLQSDPSRASSCFMSGDGGAGGSQPDCLIFLKDLNTVGAGVNGLVSTVGGRYLPGNAGCRQGFELVEVPWLVPGFSDGVRDGGVRAECRDSELPFPGTVQGAAQLNQALAGGNPVPDGQPRRRQLRFLDGALVNQSELFILFEETYETFVGAPTDRTVVYGYLRVRRSPAELNPADFVGLTEATVTRSPPPRPGAQCDPQLLADLGVDGGTPPGLRMAGLLGNPANYDLVDGGVAGTNGAIHYYCEDTGLFNGGALDNGSANATKVACPTGSKVLFFNVCSPTGACARTPATMASEPCQQQFVTDPSNTQCTDNSECRSGRCGTNGLCVRASCGDTLRGWKANNLIVTEGGADDQPLFYTCTNTSQPLCDTNRLDLRADKTFYRKLPSTPKTFTPLPVLIDNAFRYKTRFRSTVSGSTLGFAPVRCRRGSNATPYCYDPAQIDEARKRLDCLVNIYSDSSQYNQLSSTDQSMLNATLQESFSQSATGGRDGFERLNAELLIMLGDEALTSAYASRFDIAAAGGANFKGSAFEPTGIDVGCRSHFHAAFRGAASWGVAGMGEGRSLRLGAVAT